MIHTRCAQNLWSVPLFLGVPPLIVEIVKMVRCSLLHSLWRFLGRMEVGVQTNKSGRSESCAS
jgi:hypothetical protein